MLGVMQVPQGQVMCLVGEPDAVVRTIQLIWGGSAAQLLQQQQHQPWQQQQQQQQSPQQRQKQETQQRAQGEQLVATPRQKVADLCKVFETKVPQFPLLDVGTCEKGYSYYYYHYHYHYCYY